MLLIKKTKYIARTISKTCIEHSLKPKKNRQKIVDKTNAQGIQNPTTVSVERPITDPSKWFIHTTEPNSWNAVILTAR